MRRDHLPALGAVLHLGLTQSVVLASLPLLASRTGVAYPTWSWILGGALLLYAVAAPAWGRRIDARGPGDVHLVTAGGAAAGNVLLLLALFLPDPVWVLGTIVASRVVYAAFAAGQYPTSQAAVLAGAGPRDAQSALGNLVAANRVARLAGPALVGLTAGVRFRLPIALLVAAGGLLVTLTWALRDEAPAAPPSPASSGDGGETPSGSRGLLPASPSTLRKVAPALGLAFVVTASVGYLQFGLTYALGDRFGLAPEAASQLLSQVLFAVAAATIVVQLGVLRLVEARPRLQAGLAAGGVVAGSGLLAGTGTRPALFAAVGLLALGHGLTSPAYTTWARARDPAATGGIMGSIMSIHTLGYASGTLAAGLLGPQLPASPFVLLVPAALLQAAAAVPIIASRRPSPAPPEAPDEADASDPKVEDPAPASR